jgi:molybdopterin/thiamine biosynthesis adenylyltransferase
VGSQLPASPFLRLQYSAMKSKLFVVCPNVTMRSDREGLTFLGERYTLTLRCSGEQAHEISAALRQGVPYEELQRRVCLAGLEQALCRLTASRLVANVSRLPQETTGPWTEQYWYFASSGFDPQEAARLIRESRVALVGVGGVGSVVLENLVACGVKNFVLIDHDRVEITNLNRQFIYPLSSVGLPKVEESAKYVLARSPSSSVSTHQVNIKSHSALTPILEKEDVSIVVLAADTPAGEIEGIVARACQDRSVPFTMAGLGIGQGFYGPLIIPGKTPSFAEFHTLLQAHRALALKSEASSRVSGVLTGSFGPTNSIVSSLLSREVVHFIAGDAQVHSAGRRVYVDFRTPAFQVFP